MTGDPFGTAALRAAVLTSWRDSPTRFREDANSEEDLRLGGYRDRLLVELAQNAADAASAAGVPGTLRLAVVDGELRAANTGATLDTAGVAALASLRASAKRAEQSVGRFGVGFAAVLAVTDEPRVVSRSGGVAFSAARTAAEVAAQPELAAQAGERGGHVPVLRLVWPTDEEPPPDGFDTEVRLPLRPGVDVAALLADLADQAADLLLALPGLSRIEVADAHWWREQADPDNPVVHGPAGAVSWLVRRAAGRLAPDVVRRLGVEDQQRPLWTVCWGVPMAAGAPAPISEDVLHAPTPTDERLSLPARLLATLPVEPSRRRLLPGPAADAVLAEAARHYPDLVAALPAEQRTALVPLPGFPLSEVDDRLRGLVLAELRAAEWLPLAGGGVTAPARAVVLDVPSPELVELLRPEVPGLLVAELAEPRHATALAALEVRRLGMAEVAAAVANVRAEPSWWRRLYAALDPIAEVDARAREDLATLPVPLADEPGALPGVARTVLGPRGVLVLDADQATRDLLATVDVSGLRIAHPEGVHPLLTRLGARAAGPAGLLAAEPLREAVERSVADAEAGLDVSGLAEAVLRLVDDAGLHPGEQGWLAALALPDAEGEWRRADELVLPGAPLLDVLAEDTPLGVLAESVAARWPEQALTAVGCLRTFTLVVDESPVEPDHDLADEEDWWHAADEPPARLVGIRDLDLVADDAWPRALALLAADPDTRRALRDPDGYPAWWLARHALLAGQSPRSWRAADAHDLAGLYDPVPDLGLEPALLAAVGVRSELDVADRDDAADLLRRLGDPARSVLGGVVLRAHAVLAEAVRDGLLDPADVDPPDQVRVLAGAAVDAGPVLVLDSPWLLGVLPPERVVAAGELLPPGAGLDPESDPDESASLAESLAELLDLPLASEAAAAEPEQPGELVPWAELGAVRLACELLGVPVPDGSVLVHDELLVTGAGGRRQVPWWVTDDGRVHTEDTAEGLARALAWTTGRWPERHAFAALIADPTPATLLG